MTRLTRIKVEGFKSLRSVDLELRDVNVLIGANGSGKSNLVQVFDLLSFLVNGDLQLFVARSGGASSILHYGPGVTQTLFCELRLEGQSDVSSYRFRVAHAAVDRVVFTEENVAFQKADRDTPFEQSLGVGQQESDLVKWAESRNPKTAKTVAQVFRRRLASLRSFHFHDTSPSAPMCLMQDIDRNRFLAGNGGNLAAFLYMLQEAHPQHFARIREYSQLVIPYFKDFVLAPDNISPKHIQLRWRDSNPDYEFGAHHLSDGSLRAIALLTALLQPEEFMPSLFIIDEPELGLHPNAVGLIGQLIKAVSSKRQVIVATQSSRLLREFTPDDVVVVERIEDRIGRGESVFKRLSDQDFHDWLQEYDLGVLHDMNITGGGPQ